MISNSNDNFQLLFMQRWGLLSTYYGPLDVLSIIENGKKYDHLIEHTVNIPFRGHTLKVLDLEMMIKLKKASNVPKDKLKIPILEETLRQLQEYENRCC